MNRRSLAALVLVNAVLLAVVAVTSLAPQPAEAQFVPARQYLMIAGEVQARGPAAAVYIIDLHSTLMVVARFDSRTGNLNFIDSRDIGRDLRPGGAE